MANATIFAAGSGRSILDAAAEAGLLLEHSCRTGRCGACKAQVLEGRTRALYPEIALTEAERAQGYVLTCAREAEDDVALNVSDLGFPADIVARTLPCRIASIKRLAPAVVGVRLRLPPNARLKYLPGQYLDLTRAGVRRSYSIANAPRDDGMLEFHIRHVTDGQMSRYWFDEAQGNDLLHLHGPQGTFFLRDIADRHLVFLATGTGLAPIKAMVEQLATMKPEERPNSVTLFWGGRYLPDLYWMAIAEYDIRFVPVLSRPDVGWTGMVGHVQDRFLDIRPDLAETVVYACGSPLMIDDARARLEAEGLAPGCFFADAFVSSD
nr:FAD-binding oxidoreductase [Sphingosinicella soli]